jgi:hypothetical protein
MDVLRNLARGHERVQTGVANRSAAGHAPEGGRALDGGDDQGEVDLLHDVAC